MNTVFAKTIRYRRYAANNLIKQKSKFSIQRLGYAPLCKTYQWKRNFENTHYKTTDSLTKIVCPPKYVLYQELKIKYASQRILNSLAAHYSTVENKVSSITKTESTKTRQTRL